MLFIDHCVGNQPDGEMEAVANWLKYDRSSKSNRRDIDSEGNDWYGFDHPEDLK